MKSAQSTNLKGLIGEFTYPSLFQIYHKIILTITQTQHFFLNYRSVTYMIPEVFWHSHNKMAPFSFQKNSKNIIKVRKVQHNLLKLLNLYLLYS